MRILSRTGWLALLLGALIVATIVLGAVLAFQKGSPAVVTGLINSATPTPAVPQGVYREAVVGTPTMINPLLATNQVDRDLSALIFSGLTRADERGEIVPELAESWKIEEDGRRYVFTLRQGVTWHDGQPFTASDVLFTIRLMQDPAFPGSPVLADFWRTVTVETPDERTVVCTLPRTFAPFLAYTGIGILPEHQLAAVKAGDLPNDPFNLQPVGTGPFAFAGLDTAKVEVALKPHADYYGQQAQLVGLRFHAYPNTQAAIQAVVQGDVDGIGYIPARSLSQSGAIGSSANVYGPSLAGYTALFLNLKLPIFAEREVRQAMALATNREALVKDGLQGWGTPGNSPILPSSWASAAQSWPYDPARAAQLLDGAGWKPGADGIRQKNGQPLTFQLLTDSDPARTAVANLLAAQYGAIGAKVTVVVRSPEEVTQLIATRRYESALSGWEGLASDPDPYQGWHSSQAETGYNFANWTNQQADQVLEEGRLTTDGAKRKAAYTTFQQLFATEVPSLILYYPQYHFAVSKRIDGVTADPLDTPADRFRNIADWHFLPQP
jgi:peptide/nickel transport system substrate-binding protein